MGVAAMRMAAAAKPRTLHDAMVGRTVVKILGQNRAPQVDLGKLISDPSYNPMNFFKQANAHGVNVMKDVMNQATVPLPDEKAARVAEKKSKKKDKSSSSSNCSSSG